MALEVVGVRHHSPACARLVEATVRARRPRFVLVEGPADMNPRMAELALPHALPVAIFSYATGAEGSYASWAPLCDYSPEQVALSAAREVSAEALFIDLPAWDPAFSEVKNRYSDRHDRASDRIAALVERLGVDDTDALWDHLFEQPASPEALREGLDLYFAELRGSEPAGARDAPREAYMARWIAWAMDACEAGGGGDVVVVCGGFHKPALEAAWRAVSERSRPEIPAREPGVRTGSYLTPYSFRRLDSFVGYESGMPSPAFYQLVWELGPAGAAEAMMFRAVERLRDRKQRVSAADAIAASALAQGLGALRGHAALARVDVLDGLAGALVKDGLDAPLPWSRRGRILPRTEPLLVEIVQAFSGERVGRLAEGTPRPPLVADAFDALARAGITVGAAPSMVDLSLAEPRGLEQSRVLHRLRVLGVPGFERKRAPSFLRGDTLIGESWLVQRVLDADAALIEAAAYGATLEAAAAARIEERIAAARGLAALAALLFEAALVGIHTLAARLLDEIRRVVGEEPSFEALGAALGRLLSLWKHDTLLGAAGAAELGEAVAAAFDRGLWLLEGIHGPALPASPPEIAAVAALRDALRHAEKALGLDRARALAVMHRRAHDREAPPAVRGAGLGFLWSAGFYAAPEQAEAEATAAARAAAHPATFGDFLAGLFALAREEVVRAPGLLAALDAVVAGLDRDDFLVAIPSLRLSFGYFPPREKEQIAREIVALHGGPAAVARDLLHLSVDAETTLRGMALDAAALASARRYGLEDGDDPPGGRGPVSSTDLTREGGPLGQRIRARGLRRGDVVGRYVIVGAIGRGGMGAVYEAYDTQLARRVAVKVLHPSSSTAERQARLSREAQAMARLSHPNVVTVYDVGTFEGGLFIAMELIQGQTLKRWIADPHPFREVLAKVSAAGRGLAAAHAAGLVHRDFKPENVLMGDDGRVVVTDFGIARAEGGAGAEPPGEVAAITTDDPDVTLPPQPAGALEEPMTRAGAILGTLGYFAPELAGDEREDARSDQFGFCATLYRALYRQPAFAVDDLTVYVASSLKGPRPPPAGTGVPGWVHQVIVKGLSVRPEDRYPSMDALLAALARDPTRLRRRWMGAGAALGLVALGALGYVRRGQALRAECAAAGRAVDEIWSTEARAGVRASLGTAKEGTAARVVGALDDYAARWAQVRGDVCRSAQRPESEAAAGLAAGCLDHARQELAAMVDLLGRADDKIHPRALRAAYSLLPPEACTSPSLSRGYAALPADAAQRARVSALHRQEAAAHALFAAGRYREALGAAEGTLAAARESEQLAAQAESSLSIGDIHLRLGNAKEAIAAYLDAIGAAEAAGHDDIAGRAAASIAFAADANLHRADEGRRWLSIARGKLARVGHDDLLEAAILHTEILATSGSDPLDRTLPRYERLLALDERIWGKLSDQVAGDTNNLAIALAEGGERARSIDAYRRSLALKEQLYGPDHPDLSTSLVNLAAELCALGRYGEAEAPAERALGLAEKLGREGDLKLAWALLPLAVIAGRRGDAARAVRLADRALDVAGAHGEDAAAVLPDLLVSRGDALLALGRVDEASASCARALARMESEDRVSPGKLYEPDPLTCLGEAELRRGRTEQALAYLERGVALVRRHEQATLSFARFALARGLRAAGRDPARARTLAAQARAALEGVPELAPQLAEVDTWLAAGGR